ncbi:alanine racemase [Rheinheimera gaetbuli]
MSVIKYQSIQHKSACMISDTTANVFNEHISLPALLLKKQAALHNIDWMQRFANHSKVLLAPHAKTSMTPWLLQAQLAAGAWGLTVATPYQAHIASQAGAQRILCANQLVGAANVAIISGLMATGTEVFVFIDNAKNASVLSRAFAETNQVLPVLIELGGTAGRCGCRDNQQALALAQHILPLPGLALAGISFYEGAMAHNDNVSNVKRFIQQAAALAKVLFRQQLLQYQHMLLSGAGSVWYDIVAQELDRATLPADMQVILRPGCYVSHDHGIYQQAQQLVQQRCTLANRLGPPLQNALEIAAYVQSLPEDGLAIIACGKRDVAFDAGLPAVVRVYRAGKVLAELPESSATFRIMDQHCFWHYPAELTLEVGDIVLLVTSHPCLTFDKWRTLWLTDDNYNLLKQLPTCF